MFSISSASSLHSIPQTAWSAGLKWISPTLNSVPGLNPMQSGSHVSMAGLKRFALEDLPTGPLRDDVLSQPDELSTEEFLASARIWLRLARAR